MSYKHYGNGPTSRNAQNVVNQCVHILYALRCIFLIHCLDRVHDSQVKEPERLSRLFLNSTVTSNFSSIQDIKRPAKRCIPEHHGNRVEWVGTGHICLKVHTGPQGLGRVQVSHAILRSIYDRIFSDIHLKLQEMEVQVLSDTDFDGLRDGLSCLTPAQGLEVFNRKPWAAEFIQMHVGQDVRTKFVHMASSLYRLIMAAIHISGGPSPRGTEEAVTRLLNSETELMRNILVIGDTIGVQNGYVVCQTVCVV